MQHAQLAEADVEWGTLEGAIRLAHHDHVDPPCERGGVEASVELLHRHKHRLRQLAHEIHGLALEGKSKGFDFQDIRVSPAVRAFVQTPEELRNAICRFPAQLTKLSVELNVTLTEEGLSCFDKTKCDLWNQILDVPLGATLQPFVFLIQHKRQNGYYVRIYQLISRITLQLQRIHLYPVVLGTPDWLNKEAAENRQPSCSGILQQDAQRAGKMHRKKSSNKIKPCLSHPRAHSTNHHISYPH